MHNKLMTQNWVIGLLCNVFYHLIAIDKSCQVGHATIIESFIVALEIVNFLFLLLSCINAAVYFFVKKVFTFEIIEGKTSAKLYSLFLKGLC